MNDTFTDWRKSSRSALNGGCVEVATGWRKSSYSDTNGDCVEVGLANWRKSSHSGSTQDCIEVAAEDRVVGVRDTKLQGLGPVLEFPGHTWTAFLAITKEG